MAKSNKDQFEEEKPDTDWAAAKRLAMLAELLRLHPEVPRAYLRREIVNKWRYGGH